MLELNDVLLEGEPQTVSLMAFDGQLTCITGGTDDQRTDWLYGILGFVPVRSGYISIDGEPLMPANAATFRQLMAYVPKSLRAEGQVRRFEPPTVQDILDLKENRHLTVTTGQLNREIKMMGSADDEQAQWLALAVLRDRPILLVDSPLPDYLDYLKMQAAQGRVVLVTSDDEAYWRQADAVVELS